MAKVGIITKEKGFAAELYFLQKALKSLNQDSKKHLQNEGYPLH